MIVISLVAWSVITWLTAHTTTYGQLLATRALMGISEACYIPAALALIADYHGVKTRSLANSVHLSGVMVGAGMGGVGGIIAESHGWAQAFEWFGQLGVVLAIVTAIFLRDQRVLAAGKTAATPALEEVKIGEALRSLFSSRAFLLALGYWGLLGMSVWSVVGWMPTYLKEHFSLGQGVAGISATGYYQGASIVGILFGGWLADRWSRTRPDAPGCARAGAADRDVRGGAGHLAGFEHECAAARARWVDAVRPHEVVCRCEHDADPYAGLGQTLPRDRLWCPQPLRVCGRRHHNLRGRCAA